MDPQQSVGFAHFLAQTDIVGKSLFVILVVMSLATWYLILAKSLQASLARRRSGRFLSSFWNAPSLDAVERQLEHQHPDEPFSHLAYHAMVSSRHHARHGVNRLDEAGTASEFLTRSIRRVIDEETAKLEWGLTVLASVGSTAPFVGLFGTVWGVYHALAAIGISGQGTLDKVAGPVGEALIMTGAGLAVAIPAVLAYNAFVRSNRVVLAKLDAFAHDVYAFLTTGAHYSENDAPQVKRAPQIIKGAA
ncbi:MAG TPA: MotA/TolQ/ExbB proton channel family protein [Burkholderiales bacterium]|jgi:biopolymer transport protein ExbB|nr:MotA/TolQ/ExbB proton channel family protein [Burkholderiales bacterium]